MPITAAVIGASIQTVGGVVKGVQGISDYRRGKRMLKNLGDRPLFERPEEIDENQSIAQYYGQQGLDAETLYNYRSNLERGLSSTTSAVLQGGGSINRVGQAYDRFQTGMREVAGLDNQAKAQNRAQLLAANLKMAEYKDDAFAYKLSNYNQDRSEAINLKQAGLTAAIGAIGDIGQSVTSFAGQMNALETDKMTRGIMNGQGGSKNSSSFDTSIGAMIGKNAFNPNLGAMIGKNAFSNNSMDSLPMKLIQNGWTPPNELPSPFANPDYWGTDTESNIYNTDIQRAIWNNKIN